MAREKLLRDPVHDLIVFDLDKPDDRLLLELIDSPEFQRLRRLRQMGLAWLVFHGGEHSRFPHSIGVLHLTRRLLDRLLPGQDVDPLLVTAVKAGALLHDIGHGPFSHVTEEFFGAQHEAWTRRILLDPRTRVHQHLAVHHPELPGLVARVLGGQIEPRWLHGLIKSQLDCDRFDYLQRDSLMTGVKYGVFDLERLLLMLRVAPDRDRLVVAAKGLLPVEKYLQSRYHMYRQVYFHKAVASAEAMLNALLERARELLRTTGSFAGLADHHAVARVLPDPAHASVTDYLAVDDAAMHEALRAWESGPDCVLRDLSARLLHRHLFKAIELADFDEQDLHTRERLAQAREYLATQGLDPGYYLLAALSADQAYRPYSARQGGSDETIWVESPGAPGGLSDVRDLSPTIRVFTEYPYAVWRLFYPESHRGVELRGELVARLSG